MTVGQLKEATKDVPDDTPIVYAWTWGNLELVSLGSYLGTGGDCLILGATIKPGEYDNTVLFGDRGHE